MTDAAWEVGLEARAEGDGTRKILGKFPYGVATTVRGQFKEQIRAGAFGSMEGDIPVLFRHQVSEPLGSTTAGSAVFKDSAEALEFEVSIPAEGKATSWQEDAYRSVTAGLMRGVSPRFRIALGGERVTYDNAGMKSSRTVTKAKLVEMSLVPDPVYKSSSAEARSQSHSGGRFLFWQ